MHDSRPFITTGATRLLASTFGVLAGLGGIRHGIGEILQGNVAPGGTVIESWTEGPIATNMGGEHGRRAVPVGRRGRLKALISVSTMLVLLTDACTPTRIAEPSPVAATAPATTRAVPSVSPAPTSAVSLASPSTAGTLTPAKADAAAGGPPQPNPLPAVPEGGNKDYAPVPGVDLTKNGAAASIHGSAAAGQVVYVQNCQSCHGAEGKVGISNPGSDDGTVPVLNPLDPSFAASAKDDPATFARELDLFVQHGSRPAGPNPTFSMIPWGDQQKLTQQQIADVEAYIMQLNGVSWPGG